MSYEVITGRDDVLLIDDKGVIRDSLCVEEAEELAKMLTNAAKAVRKRLKPCPMCGGVPQMVNRAGKYYVKCDCCGLSYELKGDYDRDQAERKWNRRVE